MKFGELLDNYRKYEIYEFGENQLVKLYDNTFNEEEVAEEFKKTKIIGQSFNHVLNIEEVVRLEDRVGIVFQKVSGESLLFMLESDPLKLEEIGERLAQIHAELHHVKTKGLKKQFDYFKEEIEKCQALEDSEKKRLIDELKELPDGDVLCHGNYHLNNVVIDDHLNNVVIDDQYKVMDFNYAYIGHPMSDVAKSCIIMDVPRPLDGASPFFHEELIKMRHKMVEYYLAFYEKATDYDEELAGKFLKYAAVVRLNEGKEIEKEWLLNIIKH